MILFADWTSAMLSLQAIDGDRTPERRQAPTGAQGRDATGYVAALTELAGNWLGEAEAIYVAGMATGRGGWRETGYVAAPAGLVDLLPLAEALRLPGGEVVHLLPGLEVAGALPDVMRGEELKVFGLGPAFSGIAVLPGRHAKWAEVAEGRIRRFATFISGEVGALLLGDSILSRLVPAGAVIGEAGLARGLAQRSGLLRTLFSARSLVLSGALPPAEIPGYLHGLLLGAELAEALRDFPDAARQVTLIGTETACSTYVAGLAGLAVPPDVESRQPEPLAVAAIRELHALRLTETAFHNMEPKTAQGGAA